MVEDISKDQALKTIVKGSGIGFFGMIFSNLILYVLRVILARSLTTNEYGVLFLAISLISMLMFLAMLGIGDGILKYIPHYRIKGDNERVKGVIVSSFYILFPVSIVVFIVLFIFAEQISVIFFSEPMLTPIIRMFSVIIPLFAIYNVFSITMTSFKKLEYPVISWLICKPLSILIIVIISFVLGFGLLGAAFAYVVGFAVSAVMAVIFLETRVFPVFRNKIKAIQMKKKLIIFSLPLIVYGILWNFMSKIDTLMLGMMMTSFDVGLYQAAIPTSQFLFMFSSVLTGLFLPLISELLAKDKIENIGVVYRTIPKWIFYFNFPLFIIFFMYPNVVLNMVFGSDYIQAANSLRILSLGFFVYSIGILSTIMLTAFEKTKYHMVNSGLALLVGIVLNYVLIPLYGINGAAMATTITFIFYVSMPIFETYRISGKTPFHIDMFKSLVSGTVSMFIIYTATKLFFAELNIWIMSIMFFMFILSYTILMLALKGLSKDDIMILKAIEKKTGIRVEILNKIIKKFI
ncbi:MAG: oligosaccharide flippase family protein [Candidatus Aenigmarchaeota archaeon]|nr:oligosaccharide flippase family protein [Candidatus Aenigmarchaeota archaeon]